MTARREFSSIKPGVLLERTEQRAQGPGEGEATLWHAATGGELRSSSSSVFLTIHRFPSCLSIAEKVALLSNSPLGFLCSITAIAIKCPWRQTSPLLIWVIQWSLSVPPLSHMVAERTCSLFDQRTSVQGPVKSKVPRDSQESLKDETLAVPSNSSALLCTRMCTYVSYVWASIYLNIHPSAAQIRPESLQVTPVWQLNAGRARHHHQLPDILFSFGY